MLQVLNPRLMTKTLLVAAFLLAPTLLVGLPVGHAQASGCVAQISDVSIVQGLWLDSGSSYTLRVVVENTGSDAVPGTAKLLYTVTYANDATQSGSKVVTFGGSPQTHTFTHTVNDADGKAEAVVRFDTTPAAGSCAVPVDGDAREWGFWVDQKPDLRIDDFELRRLNVGGQSFGTVNWDAVRTTRHRSTTAQQDAETCFYETNNLPGKVYFQLAVRNLGNAPFQEPADDAADPTDDRNLTVAVRMTVNATGSSAIASTITRDISVALGTSGDGTDRANVIFPSPYDLLNNMSLKDITFTIDPNNKVPEGSAGEDNNQLRSAATEGAEPFFFDIRAPDLTGSFTATANQAARTISVTDWELHNIGTAIAGESPGGTGDDASLCRSKDGRGFVARLYLDVVEPDSLKVETERITLAPGDSIELSDVTVEDVGAGTHTLILVVDATEAINDHARANNRFEVPVDLPDEITPTISGVAVKAKNGTAGAPMRVGDVISISGTVVDDADFTLPQNAILVDLTQPDGSALALNLSAPPAGAVADTETNETDVPAGREKVDFWLNHTYQQPGTYSLSVRAVDSAGHVGTLATPVSFELVEYEKELENVTLHLCMRTQSGDLPPTDQECRFDRANFTAPRTTTNEAGLESREGNVLNLTFRVKPGTTGLPQEAANASRKFVEITDPDGIVILQGALNLYVVESVCFNNVTGNEVTCGDVSDTSCSDTSTNCHRHTFRLRAGVGEESVAVLGASQPTCASPNTLVQNITFRKPGPYNVSIHLGDRGDNCRFRTHGIPEHPPLYSFKLWLPVNTTITNVAASPLTGGQLDAGTPANITATLGASGLVKRAVVEVFRDGELVLVKNLSRVETTDAVSLNGTYRTTIPTGIRTLLDQAGEYGFRIGVHDANHTWTYSSGSNGAVCTPTIRTCTPTLIPLRIRDTGAPRITNHTAAFAESLTPVTAVQRGSDVVFQAEVDDDTRLSRVQAVLQDATSRVERLRVNLTLVDGSTTLYRSGNLTTGDGGQLAEGAYRLVVEATDSAGTVARETKSFTVAGNLPPAFVNVVPADEGYTTPESEVQVELRDDLQGVLLNSVQVRIRVDGGAAEEPAQLVVRELETGNNGTQTFASRVRVAFPVAAQGAVHGSAIEVTVNATDGSDPPKAGSFTWNFTIDGVAPSSQLSCTPSFPDKCGVPGTQAVRRDTVFTLAASDADPAGEAVSGIAGVGLSLRRSEQTLVTEVREAGNVTFTLDELASAHGLPPLDEGVYTLTHVAVDKAGNTEPVGAGVSVMLDAQGPTVGLVVRTPLAAGWVLNATIRDASAGVSEARLSFRTGPASLQSVAMTPVPGTDLWTTLLPGAQRGQEVCYHIEARDALGNLGTNGTAQAPTCFTSENHPPQLSVLSPQEGETVGTSVTLRWQVSDIDGDPVTVRVSYRRDGDLQQVPVPLTADEQGRRVKVLDVGALLPGSYVLLVEASDDQAFNNRTTRAVNFTIGQGGGIVNRPTFDKGTIQSGEEVTVRVEIPRAARAVEAILLRDGRQVDSQPMEQDPPGSRFYLATFRVSEPGTYQVQVVGEFDDGTPFAMDGVSALTVQGGVALGGLEQVLMLLVGAAVVVMAAVALGRQRGWL